MWTIPVDGEGQDASGALYLGPSCVIGPVHSATAHSWPTRLQMLLEFHALALSASISSDSRGVPKLNLSSMKKFRFGRVSLTNSENFDLS